VIKIEVQLLRKRYFETLQKLNPQLRVGDSPYNLVYEDRKLGASLLHYNSGKIKTPLLIIPAIINRQYILDLYNDVSVIKNFCDYGFSVYMIDWGYPSKIQSKVTFYDYKIFIQKALKKISNNKFSIFGYCTGGILSVIYTAHYPNKVKNLIFLATPIDFDFDDIRILWGKFFDVEKIVNKFGNVPGEIINLIGIYLLFYHFPQFSITPDFSSEFKSYEFWRDYHRRLRWIIDTQMIPGEAYSQFIKDCYQNNLLINGKMVVGKKINLQKIDVPLLNILAKYDHIIPPESGKAIKKVISSKDYQEIIFPSSHVGLCVSIKAHKYLWPQVCDWLNNRS